MGILDFIKSKEARLQKAIETKNVSAAIQLIEDGADANTKTITLKTPIWLAVEQEDEKMVDLLLSKIIDLDVLYEGGNTVLLKSIINEANEITEKLIKNGADLNLINNEGKTALWYAVEKNNIDFTKLLVKNNADVNFKFRNEKDEIPLLYFTCAKEYNEIFKILIKTKDIDINAKASNNYSALSLSIENGNFEFVRLLLEAGADKNERGVFEATPLGFAIVKGKTEIAKLLIEQDVDFEKSGMLNANILFDAVVSKNIEVIKALLDKGLDVNSRGLAKETALMQAVIQENLELIQILFDKDADVNIQDIDRKTALFYAKDNIKILEFLLKNGADPNIQFGKDDTSLLMQFIDNEEMFKLLLENGADVNQIFKYENVNTNILNIAIKKNNLNLVELILKTGADVNQQKVDNCLRIAINKACESRRTQTIDLLFKYGKDINETFDPKTMQSMIVIKKVSFTPLMYAIVSEFSLGFGITIPYDNNKTSISSYLIDKGADIHYQTDDGQSALTFSLALSPEIADLLISKGIIPTAMDYFNSTKRFLFESEYLHQKEEYSNQGKQKSMTLDNPDKVLELLNKAIEIDNSHGLAIGFMGVVYKTMERYEEALEYINKAISLGEDNYHFYRTRAEIYAQDKQFRKAISDITKCISLAPGYSFDYYARGILYGDTNQYKLAVEDFTEAIKLSPRFIYAYNNRAYVKGQQKNIKGAISDLKKALRVDPENTKILSHIGVKHNELFNNTNDISYLHTSMKYFKKGMELGDSECEQLYHEVNNGLSQL